MQVVIEKTVGDTTARVECEGYEAGRLDDAMRAVNEKVFGVYLMEKVTPEELRERIGRGNPDEGDDDPDPVYKLLREIRARRECDGVLLVCVHDSEVVGCYGSGAPSRTAAEKLRAAADYMEEVESEPVAVVDSVLKEAEENSDLYEDVVIFARHRFSGAARVISSLTDPDAILALVKEGKLSLA